MRRGAKMEFVEPVQGGSSGDPSEDPRFPTHPTKPETDPIPVDLFFSDLDAADGWVSSRVLSELIYLELSMSRSEQECPRCSAWIFKYGPLQFCSSGCPENMIVVQPSG